MIKIDSTMHEEDIKEQRKLETASARMSIQKREILLNKINTQICKISEMVELLQAHPQNSSSQDEFFENWASLLSDMNGEYLDTLYELDPTDPLYESLRHTADTSGIVHLSVLATPGDILESEESRNRESIDPTDWYITDLTEN